MKDTIIENFLEKLENIGPIDTTELYDNMLNECYQDKVDELNLGVLYSKLLKENDSIGYRCGLIDYIDSLSQEREYTYIQNELYHTDSIKEIIGMIIDKIQEICNISGDYIQDIIDNEFNL